MTYKKNTILEEAKQIKKFIEENKKIPKSSSLDNGKTLSPYSMSYLLSDLVLNNRKTDYSLIGVVRYNTNEYKDTVNEKVMKDDYLQMAKKFILYCKENSRVPAYVTTTKSKVKVSFELYYYCICKIAVYLDKEKSLPNYCIFDKKDLGVANNSSSNTNAGCSNKVNSRTGCDAMGQNNSYYCGVSALQKCLYKFGINVTQKQLAVWAGTTTAGTSHNGLRTAIAQVNRKYNVNISVKEYNFSDLTIKQIKSILCNKNKAIIWHLLYRLKYGHYEFVKKINEDNNFEIVNSLGSKCNYGCYCGYIEHRSLGEQKRYINGISQKSLIVLTRS